MDQHGSPSEKLAKKIHLEPSYVSEKKNPQETIALLKTTDIFINPSRSEGLPTHSCANALQESDSRH